MHTKGESRVKAFCYNCGSCVMSVHRSLCTNIVMAFPFTIYLGVNS